MRRGEPRLSKFSAVSQIGLAEEAQWEDQNRQWRWRGYHSRLLPGSVADLERGYFAGRNVCVPLSIPWQRNPSVKIVPVWA